MPRESDTLLPMFKGKENEINSNYRKKLIRNNLRSWNEHKAFNEIYMNGNAFFDVE